MSLVSTLIDAMHILDDSALFVLAALLTCDDCDTSSEFVETDTIDRSELLEPIIIDISLNCDDFDMLFESTETDELLTFDDSGLFASKELDIFDDFDTFNASAETDT